MLKYRMLTAYNQNSLSHNHIMYSFPQLSIHKHSVPPDKQKKKNKIYMFFTQSSQAPSHHGQFGMCAWKFSMCSSNGIFPIHSSAIDRYGIQNSSNDRQILLLFHTIRTLNNYMFWSWWQPLNFSLLRSNGPSFDRQQQNQQHTQLYSLSFTFASFASLVTIGSTTFYV